MRASFADSGRFVAHPRTIRETTTASPVDGKLINYDTIAGCTFENVGNQINAPTCAERLRTSPALAEISKMNRTYSAVLCWVRMIPGALPQAPMKGVKRSLVRFIWKDCCRLHEMGFSGWWQAFLTAPLTPRESEARGCGRKSLPGFALRGIFGTLPLRGIGLKSSTFSFQTPIRASELHKSGATI
jgi:hypothetical protein